MTGTGIPLHGRTGLDQAHAGQSYLRSEPMNRFGVSADYANRQRKRCHGQQYRESQTSLRMTSFHQQDTANQTSLCATHMCTG